MIIIDVIIIIIIVITLVLVMVFVINNNSFGEYQLLVCNQTNDKREGGRHSIYKIVYREHIVCCSCFFPSRSSGTHF